MNRSKTKILIAVEDTEESIDALRTAYGMHHLDLHHIEEDPRIASSHRTVLGTVAP